LASTLGQPELLSTDISTLMRRLFWEETIRLFDARHPSFYCSCTREKVGNMLRILGKDEVNSALAELGKLAIDCDFCGQHYDFDAIDCAQLFAAENPSDAVQPGSGLKH
jgi:molecular chaperone Hsp33